MTDLEEMVKKHFGVTDDFRETGYVLSDGTWVDLSGRHAANDYRRKGDRFVVKRGPDHFAGRRFIDHRELPEEVTDKLGKAHTEGMFAFMEKTGAIRAMPGVGMGVVAKPPVEAVNSYVRGWTTFYPGDELVVDILSVEGHTADTTVIENPTVEAVMKFLDDHFDPPGATGGSMGGDWSPLIDLREHFGLWDRCGNTRFWKKRKKTPLYLNPFDGLLIAAAPVFTHGYEPRAYRVVVKDAKRAEEGEIQQAFDRNEPWVGRVVRKFFQSMAYGWAIEAIEKFSHRKRPVDYDVEWFQKMYHQQDKNFEETGNGWKDPGREELLEGILRTFGSLDNITAVNKTILPDELDEFFAQYGLMECA